MIRSTIAALLLSFCPLVRANDGIPAKTLADLKAATVFVKVAAQCGSVAGSGFLFQADGDTGLIVTNQHVVQLPPQLGRVRRLDVVFHSGRAKELVVPAELIAADELRDLAVLRVKKVPDLPKPLCHITRSAV